MDHQKIYFFILKLSSYIIYQQKDKDLITKTRIFLLSIDNTNLYQYYKRSFINNHMIPEEVQEIFVERTLIVRQESIARRNYKIGNWLKLLSLHDQNKNQSASNQIIRNQIHQNFIMQEAFWIAQVAKRFEKPQVTRDDIQLLLLSIDDGIYNRVSLLIADKVIELYKSKKIRQNFCLSILQKFINHFSHDVAVSEYFKRMRSIYQQKGDIGKIRNYFERQMKLAHDNFDLVWDQYEFWENNKQELDKNRDLYTEAKARWERQAVQFDQMQCSEANVKLSLFMLENVNQSKIDQIKYMYWLEKLSNESQKLWFLRRMALNYRQLLKPYLLKLQTLHSNDDQTLLKKYKVVIRLSENNPQIQMKYLHFLVRRINRHLLNQPLPEDYNDNWSKNVVVFRQEISAIIEKQRIGLSPEKIRSIFKQFYTLWIEVQQRIVKDKQSVSQLYQNLLKETQEPKVYEDYANSLLCLGSPKQAKNVLKRYFHNTNSDKSKQIYLNFIQIYGTIEDQLQFQFDLKSNGIKIKQVRKKQSMDIESQKQSQKNKSSNQIQKQSKSQQQIQQNKLKRQRVQIYDQIEQKILANTKKRLHVDGEHTIYLKGIPTNWNQSDVLKILVRPQSVARVSLISKNNEQKDYCYIQYNSKESAEYEVKNNKSGFKFYISKPPSEYDQSSTLFLCALPQSTTQAKIRQLFQKFTDNIIDIRLKLDKDKNYAYVQFDSPIHKDTAFEASQHQNPLIDGKKVLIQHCNSNRTKNKKFLPVVFLKNLAFKAQEKDIRQFFVGKNISKLSIPLTEENRPRGFAYVQFEKFKDYQQALDMKKGQIFGRQFLILRSDRQITLPKHNNAQSQSKGEDEKYRPQEKRKQNRQRKQTRKDQRTKQPQIKDNNYFGSLFK